MAARTKPTHSAHELPLLTKNVHRDTGIQIGNGGRFAPASNLELTGL
jgi:hypothetical protein